MRFPSLAALRGALVLGILTFWLPFVSVSCAGFPVARVKGSDLATGFELQAEGKRQQVSCEPLAAGALALGLAALVASFATRGGRTAAGLCAAVGAACLGLLYAKLTDDSTKAGVPLQIGLEPGYWLAVGLYVVASGLAFIRERQRSAPEYALLTARKYVEAAGTWEGRISPASSRGTR